MRTCRFLDSRIRKEIARNHTAPVSMTPVLRGHLMSLTSPTFPSAAPWVPRAWRNAPAGLCADSVRTVSQINRGGVQPRHAFKFMSWEVLHLVPALKNTLAAIRDQVQKMDLWSDLYRIRVHTISTCSKIQDFYFCNSLRTIAIEECIQWWFEWSITSTQKYDDTIYCSLEESSLSASTTSGGSQNLLLSFKQRIASNDSGVIDCLFSTRTYLAILQSRSTSATEPSINEQSIYLLLISFRFFRLVSCSATGINKLICWLELFLGPSDGSRSKLTTYHRCWCVEVLSLRSCILITADSK